MKSLSVEQDFWFVPWRFQSDISEDKYRNGTASTNTGLTFNGPGARTVRPNPNTHKHRIRTEKSPWERSFQNRTPSYWVISKVVNEFRCCDTAIGPPAQRA